MVTVERVPAPFLNAVDRWDLTHFGERLRAWGWGEVGGTMGACVGGAWPAPAGFNF